MGLDNLKQPTRRINVSPKSNSAVKKFKSDRKNDINEKRQTAHAKRKELKERLAAKNAQKEKLLNLAKDASPEEEERLKNNIAELEKQIQSEQMEIDKANQDIDMLDGEAGAIDTESDDDDDKTGDSQGDPASPSEAKNLEDEFQTGNRRKQHHQAGSNVADALAEAFQKGLNLDDTVCTYKQADATLRRTQAILGYKQGSRNGKVAIVAETDVPGHEIYRIRRDVIVSSDKVDIIQTRRAGTGVLGKGSRGNIKWTSDDVDDLIGIAIEVPPGYKGNPEDLVLPIPRLSEVEKEEIKARGERLPRQADVQLIIRWKFPKVVKGISEQYFYSFESRAGCQSIYGTAKKAAQVLYELARTAEQKYRENGGLYSVEEALPELDALAMTPIGSRQGSEEPDGKKNNKEKAGDKNPEDEQKKQEEDKKKQEEEEEKKKQAEDEEKRKLDEEKQKQKENAEGTEKSKKEKYAAYFRSEEGIDPNAKFTVDQAIKFQDQFEKASTST
ncbi:hypothetical protein V501_02384 [Pseudogymnoascus sp. VKM F-4519 (FW-2642)]|nr:hypothetical protein V501_02384 [Pseudogymnoascus sp. VKM F-4519 (FW-2642)]